MRKTHTAGTKTGEEFLKRLSEHISEFFAAGYTGEDLPTALNDCHKRLDYILNDYKRMMITEHEAAKEMMLIIGDIMC